MIFATLVDDLTIAPDTPYNLEVFTSRAGEFYLAIALYTEGGGTAMPTPGLDYMWQNDQTTTLDGSSDVDLGSIVLELYE